MVGTLTAMMHYWESRRLVYNLTLVLVTIACVLGVSAGGVRSTSAMFSELLIGIVVANVLYCAAYPAELLLRCFPVISIRRARTTMLIIGIVVGAPLALVGSVHAVYGTLQF